MSRLLDKQMVRATRSEETGRVDELLECGASINHLHKDGFTPLMRAAEKGHTDLVQLLLTRGADPNRTAKDGASALFWASVKGHAPIIELLLAAGADVSAGRRSDDGPKKKDKGYSPIRAALHGGHLGAAERLFRAGAFLDHRHLSEDVREYELRHQVMWLLALLNKPRRRTTAWSGPKPAVQITMKS